MFLIFTAEESHVQDEREYMRKEEDSAASPVNPTLGPGPDGGSTTVIYRYTDVRLGGTSFSACEELASIQEPISLLQAPVVIYVILPRETRHTSVKRRRTQDI